MKEFKWLKRSVNLESNSDKSWPIKYMFYSFSEQHKILQILVKSWVYLYKGHYRKDMSP